MSINPNTNILSGVISMNGSINKNLTLIFRSNSATTLSAVNRELAGIALQSFPFNILSDTEIKFIDRIFVGMVFLTQSLLKVNI